MLEKTTQNLKDMMEWLKEKTNDSADYISDKWHAYKNDSKELYSDLSAETQDQVRALQDDTEKAFEDMKEAKDERKEELRLKTIKNLERLADYLKK